jgi:hypothetical protein
MSAEALESGATFELCTCSRCKSLDHIAALHARLSAEPQIAGDILLRLAAKARGIAPYLETHLKHDGPCAINKLVEFACEAIALSANPYA